MIDQCDICGTDDPDMVWSDLHGEAMCGECGTPYIDGHLNLSEKWIDPVAEYHAEFDEFVPHGVLVDLTDRPREWEHRMQDFRMWAEDNYEELVGETR